MIIGQPPCFVVIELGHGRMTAVSVGRRRGQWSVRRYVDAPLSLHPLKDDAELVGREIREILRGAGIRRRTCAVILPLDWAFVFRTRVPDLSDEESRSFLDIQAEREIPVPLETLSVSVPDGVRSVAGRLVTVAAIRRAHVMALLRALKAAKLRPCRMTFGVTCLSAPDDSRGRDLVALLMQPDRFDMAIFRNGDLVALRTLEHQYEHIGGERSVPVGFDATHIRMTLGELPDGVAGDAQETLVYGPEGMLRDLLPELTEAFRRMGLSVAAGAVAPSIPFARDESFEKAWSVAPAPLALAAKCLTGQPVPFEFLPRRVSFLRGAARRLPSRKSRWAAAASLVLLLLLGGPLLIQQWKLHRLEAQWLSIQPEVERLEALQDKVGNFGGWYSGSTNSLSILRALSEAFPEEGVIWAKRLTIHEPTDKKPFVRVSCSGYARSREAWLDLLDRLRATEGIDDLRFKQLRGDSPMGFEMDFDWVPGGNHEI